MDKAFGIVNPAGNHISVEGLQSYRTIGAFSFLGTYQRYRLPDLEYEQQRNSTRSRSMRTVNRVRLWNTWEQGGTITSTPSGGSCVSFSLKTALTMTFTILILPHSLRISSALRMHYPYVVIVPNYMVYTENYDKLLDTHINSGADITLLYHSTDNAKETFLNCDLLNLNRQKGVLSIEKNRGTAKSRNIFMDTYIMKKELFIELIHKAKSLSSMYTLAQIVNNQCNELDIRGVSHRGYFASITDFKSYYDANMSLINYKNAMNLFDEEWPIYTRTNDSCPTQYFETAAVKTSVVSNGCLIEGTVENSVIGRGCTIHKGAVVKNCVILPGAVIGKDVHIENQVVDKGANLLHAKELIAPPERPGYIRRGDTI